MKPARAVLPALCWILLVGSYDAAAAQVWSLDAYAGRENYSAIPASTASTTGVLGVRFNQERRLFQAAVGLPMASETVTWGIVAFGDRFAVRRGGFAVGADVSVLAHAQRDPVADNSGRGLKADLFPMVSHSFRNALLEFRSGPSWYGSRLGGVGWTRKLWTTEFQAGVQANEDILVQSDIRHDRGPQSEEYTRVGLSFSARLGGAIARAGVGQWIAGVTDSPPEWNASITLPARPGLWIFSSIQRESFNPLFLNPTRTSWSTGVTFRIGGREMPAPSNTVRIEQGNRVVIRVPVAEVSDSISIAGDFTGWKPVPMRRQGSDWHFDATLAPGVYRFAFRTEDGKWIVPESIPNRADDGMGGWNAVLVVP